MSIIVCADCSKYVDIDFDYVEETPDGTICENCAEDRAEKKSSVEKYIDAANPVNPRRLK